MHRPTGYTDLMHRTLAPHDQRGKKKAQSAWIHVSKWCYFSWQQMARGEITAPHWNKETHILTRRNTYFSIPASNQTCVTVPNTVKMSVLSFSEVRILRQSNITPWIISSIQQAVRLWKKAKRKTQYAHISHWLLEWIMRLVCLYLCKRVMVSNCHWFDTSRCLYQQVYNGKHTDIAKTNYPLA